MKFKLNKKIKKRADFLLTVFLVFGILVAINFLAHYLFYRFDLTENKVYSISQTTKNILKDVDDIVVVKLYFSKNLSPQFQNITQNVKDILAEYKAYSNNKIKIEEINPSDNPEEEEKMQMLGIPKIRFNVIKNDKLEVSDGYLGMAIFYNGKKEVIPVIKDNSNLEYEITGIIKKLTLKETPQINFANGNGEMGNDQIKYLFDSLSKEYQIGFSDLSTGNLLPENVKALIILQPTTKISDREKYVLDQFLMRGGKVFLFYDSATVDQNLAVKQVEADFNDFLKHYGITINKDFIVDIKSNGQVAFGGGPFPVAVQYPFWPRILKENLNKNNPITADLSSLLFPWVSSVDILNDKIDGKTVIRLAESSEKSWTIDTTGNISPFQKFSPIGKEKKHLIAVNLRGNFDSFFNKENIPNKKDKEEEKFISKTDKGNLTVIGDADFLKDSFLMRSPENLVFFQNLIDALVLDDNLIKIRSKNLQDRTIKRDIDNKEKKKIKYLNIFGPTIAVIFLGLLNFWFRRKRKLS